MFQEPFINIDFGIEPLPGLEDWNAQIEELNSLRRNCPECFKDWSGGDWGYSNETGLRGLGYGGWNLNNIIFQIMDTTHHPNWLSEWVRNGWQAEKASRYITYHRDVKFYGGTVLKMADFVSIFGWKSNLISFGPDIALRTTERIALNFSAQTVVNGARTAGNIWKGATVPATIWGTGYSILLREVVYDKAYREGAFGMF